MALESSCRCRYTHTHNVRLRQTNDRLLQQKCFGSSIRLRPRHHERHFGPGPLASCPAPYHLACCGFEVSALYCAWSDMHYIALALRIFLSRQSRIRMPRQQARCQCPRPKLDLIGAPESSLHFEEKLKVSRNTSPEHLGSKVAALAALVHITWLRNFGDPSGSSWAGWQMGLGYRSRVSVSMRDDFPRPRNFGFRKTLHCLYKSRMKVSKRPKFFAALSAVTTLQHLQEYIGMLCTFWGPSEFA